MSRFGQVITAMVTPFDDNLEIDEEGVVRLVNYLFDNGSDGIVVCGTTGEAPTLTPEEKLRLFKLVKQAAKGRGPLIAGTGDNETAFSIEMTEKAAEIGMDAVLLVAPYYNRPSQEGMYRHFGAIAKAVPGIPAILYNVPGRTASNLEAATVARLSHDYESIVAVKEASGNLVQAAEIAASARSGFEIYSGEDGLVLPLLSVGGCGVISVTSHVVGKDLKAMHQAFFAGDCQKAKDLHLRMLPIVKACFQPTTPSPAPVKAALNLLGLKVGGLRLPLVEANEHEQAVVARALHNYQLLA
jgi:4-hydroxy-tetrahydrodipicolinate synthase